MDARPLVSVCCITYNHAPYIGEALDGFLAQRTSFPFEVIVHDDASTDGTADLVRAYERKHPGMIRGIYQTENQYRQEPGRVTSLIRAAAQGEFIATCEGDDHWIDPDKLQAQVDLMRAEPDLSFCFTNAYNEYAGGRREDYVRGWLQGRELRTHWTQADIVERNFVPTAGVLYRRERLQQLAHLGMADLALDWLFYVALSATGPFAFLDRISAVRRVHAGGVISSKDVLVKVDLNLSLLSRIDQLTQGRYPEILNRRRSAFYVQAIQHCVDTGAPARGAEYLRALKKDPGARGLIDDRSMLRFTLLTRLPRLARMIHRVRTAR